mmetsp:Transcript_33263/g.77301  ORF Transcript_33263/g.77301 Transcript_33263/m.77301 type:complete len:409 (-) Transcript_33263:103-1329(-)
MAAGTNAWEEDDSLEAVESDLLVPEDSRGRRPEAQCCARLWSRWRGVLAATAVGLLTTAVFAAVLLSPTKRTRTKIISRGPPPLMQKFGSSCATTGGMPACPAIGIFERPDVLQVAAENLMRIGHRLLDPEDVYPVLHIVGENLRNVSARIQESAPELSVALQMIQLSDEEQDAVVTCLRLLGDHRVQGLGLIVARAVRESHSLEPGVVRLHIEQSLRPIAAHVQKIENEVVPEHLRRLWVGGEPWAMTLDLENLRVMAAQPGNTSADNAVDEAPSVPISLKETSLGVEVGAMEEGRALVEFLKLVARIKGRETAIPSWVASVSEKVRSEQLSCELYSPELNSKDLMRAWLCPLKFGSQGLDALRVASQRSYRTATAASERSAALRGTGPGLSNVDSASPQGARSHVA